MDGLDCVSFHSYPPTPLNVLLCKSNEADLIFWGNESSIEPEKILCVTSEDLKPAKESISDEEMLQNLKLFQSSLNLHSSLQQPNPLFKNQAILSSSPCSIHIKQSCNLSRRELAIFSNSSLLLLLSPHFLEPLNQSKARAEEIFPGTNVENDQQEAIAGQIFPDTDVQNDQQQVRAEEFVPDTNVGNDQQDARAEQVSPDTNVENGQQQARADAAIENDQQESSADEILPDTVVENDQQEAKTATNILHCSKTPTKRAFLDISIDGQPAGRILIGLYGQDVPAGAARFSSLVSGAAGISYRRKEFIKIMQNYVQHGGVRSYSVDAELARQIGSNLAAETLMDEWGREYERCPGVKNAAGTVSIIVRDPLKPPPKLKLVARKGKLEIDQEEVGTDPNGTEFVIAIKDSPELDSSALVVGRVLEGMDVVERIGQVKTVQENTGSPYFRVAKLIGDKRAVVAERGFNRPYSKVIVTNCGLME